MKFSSIAVSAAISLILSISALAQSSGLSPADREKLLIDKITALEERLTALEKQWGEAAAAGGPIPPASRATSAVAEQSVPAPAESTTDAKHSWLKDTTLSFYFDGHYAWNPNRPLGRGNLLRAYDTIANNFSINQTGMVIESAANPAAGKRWGYRLDAMFGQATETLQGGAQNESRPQVYRNIYQAYGSYVLPAGKGLTVDFGKWASSLGPEGNYTKDQINYSRSYFFNFLPFYHMGFRSTYPVNDKFGFSYWLVNGANQTEDFNGFKSQLVQAAVKPSKKLSWTIQYYAGREQRDLLATSNPGLPLAPSQPGLAMPTRVRGPRGRFHVIDTYAFWNATNKLTAGGGFTYVINRVESNSPPQSIVGSSAYLRYQLAPKVYLGQRYVRLNDHAGLFSGVTQNLNDVTSTLGFRPVDGFESRVEYRRDFSSTPFFPRGDAGSLHKHQDTFTLGLLWWFGGKSGTW